MQNQYLDYIVNSTFHGVNSFFVLSFENNAHRISHKKYFPPTVEIKDYNVMTDGRNFFDQRVKNDTWIYKNVKKIVTTQGDDNTTDYLLDYPYYKKKL